ncbi:hypothetical protein Tco_0980298, partial [Tanacetum coccineum]
WLAADGDQAKVGESGSRSFETAADAGGKQRLMASGVVVMSGMVVTSSGRANVMRWGGG